MLLHSPHPLRQAMKKNVVGNLKGKIVMKASCATCIFAAEVKHCSTMHMLMLRDDSCPAIGFVFPASCFANVSCMLCVVLCSLPPSASLCRSPALAPPQNICSPFCPLHLISVLLCMCAHQAKNQNIKKKPIVAQMDLANKAICYAMRNPPKGHSKMPYTDIQKLVCKKDGKKPTTAAMCQAASNFKKVKGMRGRPLGSNRTTKDEDKVLMKTFHKTRPPGHGITSRALHDALPKDFSECGSQDVQEEARS